MGFLDRIVRSIALVAHSRVVMTSSISNNDMMPRLVSMWSQK